MLIGYWKITQLKEGRKGKRRDLIHTHTHARIVKDMGRHVHVHKLIVTVQESHEDDGNIYTHRHK